MVPLADDDSLRSLPKHGKRRPISAETDSYVLFCTLSSMHVKIALLHCHE